MAETAAVDLGAVQWSAEQRCHHTPNEQGGEDVSMAWHVIGCEFQPDGYDFVLYDLRVDSDDAEQVAQAVARKLAQS